MTILLFLLLAGLSSFIYLLLRDRADVLDSLTSNEVKIDNLREEALLSRRIRKTQRQHINNLLGALKAKDAEIERVTGLLAEEAEAKAKAVDADQIVFVLAPDETLH